MAKNTKAKAKTVKTSKYADWFNSRKYGKSSITAIRNAPRQTNDVKTGDKPLKEGGNMFYVRKILEESGRIELKDAIKKFLKVHPVQSANPESRVKTIFLQSSQYRVPIKIEKVGEETFIELA